MTTTIRLDEFVQAALAQNPPLVIELPDGSSVSVPPGILWPDETIDAIRRGQHQRAVKLILGEEQADRFTRCGGNFKLLDAMWVKAQGESAGDAKAS